MNRHQTEIIFLLDRSGSMAGLEEDTIGGFNALIEKQCSHQEKTLLTTVLFDDQYDVLWQGVDATKVTLTDQEYYVRGSTALLDAVGKTILDVDQRLSRTNKDNKPGKVIFVITTDGKENGSCEFTHKKIKAMIKHQKENNNWEFIFIGANIDAVTEAEHIGIGVHDAYNYEATKSGVESMFLMAEEALSAKRQK